MNTNDLGEVVERATKKLLELAVIELPIGVENALRGALKKEQNLIAKAQLTSMIENIEIARSKRLPICQDTGIQMFHITLGEDFPVKSKLQKIVQRSVQKATSEIPLRPNAVHPITRVNSSDNTGIHVPYIEWCIQPGTKMNIEVIPKGFGSENMSRLRMLSPGQGMKAVKEFLLDSVLEAGGKNCPPTIIGLGLGLGVDGVMRLGRKAALRPLPLRNEHPEIADLEAELLRLVNETGIGPMGLGGKTTALAVNIELGHTHTASLPVAVVFQCWAARRSEANIYSNGCVEFVSHEVKEW